MAIGTLGWRIPGAGFPEDQRAIARSEAARRVEGIEDGTSRLEGPIGATP